jgi:hypothetical protein
MFNKVTRLLGRKFDRVKRMAQDLETLRSEMEAYLKQYGMAVFHGYHRPISVSFCRRRGTPGSGWLSSLIAPFHSTRLTKHSTNSKTPIF